MKIITSLKIADFLTLINAFLSAAGIYFIFKSMFVEAAYAILAAFILDYFDGYVARKFNSQNEFGARLDAFSDVVAFGVVPPLLAIASLTEFGVLSAISLGIYISANLLRHARIFDVLKTESEIKTGLPNTVAAALLVSLSLSGIGFPKYALDFILLILSAAMLSEIKYPSHRKFGKVLMASLAAVEIILFAYSFALGGGNVFALFNVVAALIYVLLSPFLWGRLHD